MTLHVLCIIQRFDSISNVKRSDHDKLVVFRITIWWVLLISISYQNSANVMFISKYVICSMVEIHPNCHLDDVIFCRQVAYIGIVFCKYTIVAEME